MKKFSEDFKREAVKLVEVHGMRHDQAALELGIGKSTLDKWLKEYRTTNEANGLTADEKAELRELRTKLRKVTLERDLLKKAAILFAKHEE